ncbi:MAG: hypothetical protein MHM6MM_007608, partial [Cercozoa sp. M6MM]
MLWRFRCVMPWRRSSGVLTPTSSWWVGSSGLLSMCTFSVVRVLGQSLVVLTSAHNRAFCVGGDMRQLALNCVEEEVAHPLRTEEDEEYPPWHLNYFEYHMDYLLHVLRKPVISLVDGLALGGGAGVACNPLFRVVSERARIGMPETRALYVPDCGGNRFLALLPAQFGRYAACVGATLDGREAAHLRVATHFVPQERMPALLGALLSHPDVNPRDIAGVWRQVEMLLSAFHEDPQADSAAINSRVLFFSRAFDTTTAAAAFRQLASALSAG